ncbi:right-handed parallel beta-helix repeat-containing protein [Larkinella ripae]
MNDLIRIGCLIICTLFLIKCKDSDLPSEVRLMDTDTLTIAETRAINTTSIPGAIYIIDAGKAGLFKFDQTSTRADNMGVILVTANGKRYKREFTGDANVAWFGVETTDNDIGPELQLAVDSENKLSIPDGTYTQLTEVKIRSDLHIKGNAGKVMINLPKSYVSLVNGEDRALSLKNIVLDGLSWSVTSSQDATYGPITIDGPSVDNLLIQNCSSNDQTAKANTNWLTLKIQAGKTANAITVKNNSVQAKRMGCEIFNHDNYNSYAGKNIVVTNNYFHNCEFGISLSGPLDSLIVDSNYLKDCSLYGIEIAGAARNTRITNNKFEGTFDKFLEGSNDGGGNGTITGGMLISGNVTVGMCKGGVQLFNAGAVSFTKNNFSMTGMLELAHSTKGGIFTDNVIESLADKAVICDNSPDNTFTNNTISNQGSPANRATFMAYGSKATNNTLSNNKLRKGSGGLYHEAMLGGSYKASMNYDEAGNLIP